MSKEQVVLNVPADLKAWLREKADAESRSLNFIASALLQRAKEAEMQEKAA